MTEAQTESTRRFALRRGTDGLEVAVPTGETRRLHPAYSARDDFRSSAAATPSTRASRASAIVQRTRSKAFGPSLAADAPNTIHVAKFPARHQIGFAGSHV